MIQFRNSLLIILVLCALCLPTEAVAQAKRTTPTDSILEFSLQSLRGSAQNVSSRNDLLSSSNNALRQKIRSLEMEIDTLMYEDAGEYSSDSNLSIEDKASYIANNKTRRMNRNIAMLSAEQGKVKSSLRKKQQKSKDIHREADKVQKGIEDLKHRISLLSEKILRKELGAQRVILLKELKQSADELRVFEAKLKKLRRRYRKPLKRVDVLKGKNAKLKQQLYMLNDEFKSVYEDQKLLKERVKSGGLISQTKLSDIDSRLVELKARRAELEDVLVKVRKKIEDKNIKLIKNSNVEKELKQNLGAVKNENIKLKEKLEKLKKEILALQKKQFE